MVETPSIEDLKLNGKNVILRLDLDVSVKDGLVVDDARLKEAVPTIVYLQKQGVSKITVIGHRGRPEGKVAKDLSLEPVGKAFGKILQAEFGDKATELDLEMMENLRFDPREESSSLDFAKELAKNHDFYINDAFASSHRDSASITKLPKLLPSAAGFHLLEETEHLGKVLNNPSRPLVFLIGGGKMDKVAYVDKILEYADWVLLGGVLPQKVKSHCKDNGAMCVSAAHLTEDAKDIAIESAKNFIHVLEKAKTIVWNGPMGDIDSGHWEATKIVAEAIKKSNAYKVAGGGDTLRMLQTLGISDKINYISTGGGAMLDFLAHKDLPGLKALRG